MTPDRRGVIAGAAGWLTLGAAPGPAYSESVMMMLFAPDGSRELSVRLARLFGRREATLWGGYADGGGGYSVATTARLHAGAEPATVEADAMDIGVERHWTAQFERRGRRRGTMRGHVAMAAFLYPSLDPPEGEGPVPAGIELTFRAAHPPVLVREGRLEVFGRGEGTIALPDREIRVAGYAKWHEQVGERPRFAPAFTYMALCGADAGLLAVTRGDGAYGFAREGRRTTAVTGLAISAPGPERRFTASLADGRRVEGTARAIRTSSEPIEGQRRPSATVLAETGLGRLVGQINDWRG